jgi:hypothetical protein
MTIGWDVFFSYSDEGVGVRGDSIHDLNERGVGVAAVVLADRDGGVDVFEEGQGGLVYDEVVASFPLSNRIVEEFCCGSGYEVPLTLSS